jgi:diguanylate cyclase (GGDEF)-like protein
MINVTVEELQRIMSTIEEALLLHGQWREGVDRALSCHLPPTENDLQQGGHQRCAFGRWFYSSANAQLRALPTFTKIGKLHQAMHDSARTLCAHSQEQQAALVEDYDRFLGDLAEFKGELLGLRERVSFTLQNIDPLTGALKHGKLLPDLRREQKQMKESGTPYSLLLLDLDLRDVNKIRGRALGDTILRTTIQKIREELPATDKVYRYGGAEFVICLPGRNAAHANTTKEHLLKKLHQVLVEVMGVPSTALNVYYSIVELEPHAYLEELLDQATRSTYAIGL